MSAHQAVSNALRYGILAKQPCERCGNPKTVAHHEDHSKPLDVIWLCTKCHAERHRELRGLGERLGTTLRLEPELLEQLKIVAARKRIRVNDLLLEGVRHVLALHGERGA